MYIILLQVKDCTVQKESDATKRYVLMPVDNGDTCTDYYTQFQSTSPTDGGDDVGFLSKGSFAFMFKSFQWDRNDTQERQKVVCTLSLDFITDDTVTTITHDTCDV